MSDNWKRQMWVLAKKHVPLVFSFLPECKLQTYDKTYKKSCRVVRLPISFSISTWLYYKPRRLWEWQCTKCEDPANGLDVISIPMNLLFSPLVRYKPHFGQTKNGFLKLLYLWHVKIFPATISLCHSGKKKVNEILLANVIIAGSSVYPSKVLSAVTFQQKQVKSIVLLYDRIKTVSLHNCRHHPLGCCDSPLGNEDKTLAKML